MFIATIGAVSLDTFTLTQITPDVMPSNALASVEFYNSPDNVQEYAFNSYFKSYHGLI